MIIDEEFQDFDDDHFKDNKYNMYTYFKLFFKTDSDEKPILALAPRAFIFFLEYKNAEYTIF